MSCNFLFSCPDFGFYDYLQQGYEYLEQQLSDMFSDDEISPSEQRSLPLPIEIVEHILSFASIEEKFTGLPLVCKEFREITKEDKKLYSSIENVQVQILRHKYLKNRLGHPRDDFDDKISLAFTFDFAKKIGKVEDISLKTVDGVEYVSLEQTKRGKKFFLRSKSEVKEYLRKFPNINFVLFWKYPKEGLSPYTPIKSVILFQECPTKSDLYIAKKMQKMFSKPLKSQVELLFTMNGI